MATIVPISDAIVTTAVDNVGIGNTTTDVAGNYSYVWVVTEEEYNNALDVIVEANKLGYVPGGGRVSPLPSFASAVENGIVINAVLERESSSTEFYLDKYNIAFSADGGTIAIAVTCPDNTWTVEETTSWITATKSSSTNINIVANAQPTSSTSKRTSVATVVWGTTRLIINIEQAARGIVYNPIVFSGKISDASTAAGLASMAVRLNYNSGSGVSTATTNSSGNYSITLSFSESEWINFSGNILVSDTNTYNGNSATIPKPNYATAVASGVTTNLQLVKKVVDETFNIYPTSLSFKGSGETKSVILYKTAGDNNVSIDPGVTAAWYASAPAGSSSEMSMTLVPVDSTTMRIDVTVTAWSVPSSTPSQNQVHNLVWNINSGRSNGLSIPLQMSQVAIVEEDFKAIVDGPNPAIANFPYNSTTSTPKRTVTVSGLSGRSWKATKTDDWVYIIYGSDGVSFTISCTTNSAVTPRTSIIKVETTTGTNASVNIAVQQNAAPSPDYNLTVSPTYLEWQYDQYDQSQAKRVEISTNAPSWNYSVGGNFGAYKSGNNLYIYPTSMNDSGSDNNGSASITAGTRSQSVYLTQYGY